MGLKSGMIKPSMEGKGHILKVVCGRGDEKAVLKRVLAQYLKDRRMYEFFLMFYHGVLIIRIQAPKK
jgi:hypothetical protein